MKNIVIIVLAAVSLSSCGIYNKYQRPADITADGLYGQEVSTDDTASIASLSWREVFADPRLQQLIDSALANNTDLLSARERIKEAEATLMSARLAYLPSFMLTPQGGVSSFDGAKGSWTYTGIASASWEVDIFGRLTNAKRRFKALYEQSLEYASITLSGTAGWTNSAGSLIVNPGKVLLSAVASLTQPLFNRGQNVAQLKIAKAQQEEARLAFQQTLLNAGSEVNNALTQVQKARGRASLRQEQVASLEEAVRSTQLLMQHGTTTYLEVLTAQQSLLSARLTQVADRFDEIQGIVNLYQALGGGRS